jgi:ribonuclease R
MRPQDEARLEKVAGEISAAERRAMAAERDTVDRLIASWLSKRVGAVFQGRIRGVTRSGLFVELLESGADGFVPISTLGSDFYEFEETHHRLVGRSTGETFRLGDALEVRLVEALPFAGSLRFEILGHDGESRGRSRGKGRPPRGGPPGRGKGKAGKGKAAEKRQSRRTRGS